MRQSFGIYSALLSYAKYVVVHINNAAEYDWYGGFLSHGGGHGGISIETTMVTTGGSFIYSSF